MAPPDTLPDASEDDENYHESSDEDFNPTVLAAEASSSSEDEGTTEADGSNAASRKRKRKAPSPAELDSGDEMTIEAVRKRRSKKKKGVADGGDDDLILSDDDEGGEGGLIKTRAQRRVEYVVSIWSVVTRC